MSKVEHVQTRDPKKYTPEGFHDVLVQKDSPDYDSPLEDFLTKPSFIDPNKEMYEMVSDQRKDTGHRNLVRLRCTQEDYELMLAENTAQARATEAAVTPTTQQKEGLHYEEVSKGGQPLRSS